MPRRSFDLGRDSPFLDVVSHARGVPGRRVQLSPGLIEQIARTVRRTPEVMVKVSGGGKSAKAVGAHFKYLTRGEFEIETDEGQHLKGRGPESALIDDWELDLDAAQSRSAYRGVPGRKPAKLVHNIVLSMPAGTPAAGVLEASRTFAREEFGLKHRYAMVLHTDQPHPHVHLVVKAMSEQGKRMNIRKAILREWRREFARHLRSQGIAANATQRAVRGVIKPQKSDGIYRAMCAGRSTHIRGRAESVGAQLCAGNIQIEAGKAQLLDTRREVVRGWLALRETLRTAGSDELADQVGRFLKAMPPPLTEREWLTHGLAHHARNVGSRVREPLSS